MLIRDKKTIAELQQEFQKVFPYLKLEFYLHKHDDQEGSPKKELLDHEKMIGDIRKGGAEGEFPLDAEMEVAEFEEAMRKNHGLNVQVFRKSTQDVWLQTIATDNWTLAQQNEKASTYFTG